jgi:hypothetical protein
MPKLEGVDVKQIGERVIKETGDYTFEGDVVAVITKRSGQIRYVVEDDRGLLMIFAPHQIERKA